MILDVRTMYIAMGATCFIVAAGLLALQARRPWRDGALQWTLGWAVQGVFWLLLGLRGIIWNFVSIVVATTFLAASFSLLYAAVREFQGRAYNRSILFFPPAATFVFFWYFSADVDRISYRVIFFSFLTILQISTIVWALFRDTSLRERRSARLTGFAFIIFGVIYLIRLLEGLTLPFEYLSVLQVTATRNVNLMVALGVVMLSSIGFVLMMRDRAEERLQESEQRWATTLASIGDAVIATDEDGRITFMNAVAEELTGWTLSEAVAGHVTKVFNIVNEQTRRKVENPVAKVLEQGNIVGLANHTLLVRRDGTEVPIDDSGAPIRDPNGKTMGVVLVFRDITERKQAEEKLRKDAILLNQTGEIAKLGGWEIDVATMKQIWTDETYKIHDVDKNTYDPNVEKEINSFSPESKPLIEKAVQDAIDYGKPYDLELEFITAKGNHKITRAIGNAELENEKVKRVYGIFQDITEQKQVEEALQESEEKYRTLFETMSEGFAIDEIILDKDGKPCDLRYLAMNPAFERHTGLKAKDIIGKTTLELFPEAEHIWFERYGKVVLTGEPGHFEALFGPLERWFEVIAYRIDNRRLATIFTDITERKRAEEELRESEERYRLLVEYTPTAIYEMDFNEKRFKTVNDGMCRMLGYTKAELLAINPMDILDKESGKIFLDRIRKAQAGEAIAESIEYKAKKKDGTEMWGILHTKFEYSKGKIVGAFVVAHDITERKRAEVLLQRQAELLHLSYDAIIVWQPGGRIESWNKGAEELYGYSEEEAVGQVTHDLLKTIHPEPWPQIEKKLRERKSWEGELKHRTRDGREVTVSARHQIIQDADDVERVLETNRDITERKRAEARLAYLASFPERNTNPIMEVDLGGVVRYMNPAALNLFPDLREKGLTHPWLVDWANTVRPFREGQTDTGVRNVDVGQHTYQQTFYYAAPDPLVRIYGLDITERKKAEEGLKKAHEALQVHAGSLEAANKELESFSYSVSHDLLSPLRAIAGFTRMILDEKGATFDPETGRKFGIIQENAEKMGQLIDNLLRLSRLGRAELHQSKLDMGDLVREVLQEIRMTDPGREFMTEIGDLPAAQGDPAMIRQVFANLLSNAVKFTREKQGARIEVGSFERAGEQVYYVKDNGVGFDMKYYNLR